MSLSQTHPLWLSCGSNPFEVHKAVTQARMLSGRYRTQNLCKYFTSESSGFCQIGCIEKIEDIKHILINCSNLENERRHQLYIWKNKLSGEKHISEIVGQILNSDEDTLVQFLLDCSVVSSVVSATQVYGQEFLYALFKLTRNWCYSLHKARLVKLGRWTNYRF